MSAPIIAAYDPFLEDRAPVELALAIAELTGSDVIAVSVRPSPYVGGWADLYVADTGPDETIESALLRLRAAFRVTTRVVTDASVPRALHTLAREDGAAMIVVGSTGRGRTGRVLPGSTAERLLHGTPCPVALAPHGYVRAPVDAIAVGFVDSPKGTPPWRSRTCSPLGRTPICAWSRRSIPPARWTRRRTTARRRRAGSRSRVATARLSRRR